MFIYIINLFYNLSTILKSEILSECDSISPQFNETDSTCCKHLSFLVFAFSVVFSFLFSLENQYMIHHV